MESTNKKIIALLPVKNEAWILNNYLNNVSKIADEIIALDDNSTDNSSEILKQYIVKVLKYPSPEKINMSEKRKLLLSEGRKSGGTHFIWLDADEMFSNDFLENGKKTILDLEPGEKISMRWVHLWKSPNSYMNDKKSPFGYIWKDFVVCDKDGFSFEDKALSENRTPGDNNNLKKLDENSGVVLHFQFVDWSRVQMKQAWYRCIELAEGHKNPRKINNTYSITLENESLKTEPIPKKWLGDFQFHVKENKNNWHLSEISNLFDKYGLEFFEPLDIWHIKELEEVFVLKMNRKPKPKKYPAWLIKLNNLKNKLKNSF